MDIGAYESEPGPPPPTGFDPAEDWFVGLTFDPIPGLTIDTGILGFGVRPGCTAGFEFDIDGLECDVPRVCCRSTILSVGKLFRENVSFMEGTDIEYERAETGYIS